MAVVLFSVVVPDTVKELFNVAAPVSVVVPETDKLLFSVVAPYIYNALFKVVAPFIKTFYKKLQMLMTFLN